MIEKVYRLLEKGRVERIGDGVYNVVGDHGTYIVARRPDGTVNCSCPGFAKKSRCSHSLAVMLLNRSLILAAERRGFIRKKGV